MNEGTNERTNEYLTQSMQRTFFYRFMSLMAQGNPLMAELLLAHLGCNGPQVAPFIIGDFASKPMFSSDEHYCRTGSFCFDRTDAIGLNATLRTASPWLRSVLAFFQASATAGQASPNAASQLRKNSRSTILSANNVSSPYLPYLHDRHSFMSE